MDAEKFVREAIGVPPTASPEEVTKKILSDAKKLGDKMEKNHRKTRRTRKLPFLAWTMLHPTRWKIVKVLAASPSSLWLSYRTLAKNAGIDRRLATFHLIDLERYGLVNRDLRLLEKKSYTKDECSDGRVLAVRCFKLSTKARRILAMRVGAFA